MKKKYKILVHLIYWLYMFNQFVFPFYIGQSEKYTWTDTGLSMFLSIINFYTIYFLIPVLLKRVKIILTLVIGVFIIIGIGYFRYYTEVVFWRDIYKAQSSDLVYMSSWFVISIRNSIISAMYAILIKLAIDWYEAQKLRTELVTQNQASELALLRSQVNPHFLFNTLNNIYSLVYKKSDQAPEAIMKLSAIMRYMLYEANTDKVMLHREIDYLKSFIELQKLRFRSDDFVKFDIVGETGNLRIAPMLLVPFIENAFKHCNRNVEGYGIVIRLQVREKTTVFEVTNYLKPHKDTAPAENRGIGLQNVRRRLELLYPGAHRLEINEDDGKYKIALTISNQ
jgi:LytS/YehU family sensor histidine kinase